MCIQHSLIVSLERQSSKLATKLPNCATLLRRWLWCTLRHYLLSHLRSCAEQAMEDKCHRIEHQQHTMSKHFACSSRRFRPLVNKRGTCEDHFPLLGRYSNDNAQPIVTSCAVCRREKRCPKSQWPANSVLCHLEIDPLGTLAHSYILTSFLHMQF